MSGQGPADGNKGKGKSTDEAPTSTSPTASTTASTSAGGSSVLSRIGRSAAGLGRDLVNTRPAGGELSALSAGDKGASSSSRGPSSGTLQETSHQNPVSFPSASASASTSAGFRSHAQQHNTAQEKAFSKFLDGTSVDFSMPEQVVGLSPAEDAWARAQWSTAAPQQVESQAWTNTPTQSQSDVAAQESRDGLDVVNLLSADGPPEEEPNYDDIELAEDEATALKRALFGGSTSTTPSLEWDNVLNFVPDFVRPHAHGAYDGDGHATAKGDWTQSTTGMQHSPEAARAWIEQWHGVLTRYDDEVWGGLSPLVAEAREEVEQLKESEPEAERPGSTKALDRLRQILGHLRVD